MHPSDNSTGATDWSQYILGCNPSTDILSCSHLHIVEIVNFVILGNTIAVFGVIANIINIRVFYKLGFQSTVNISFFGMAISDLCCLITMLWACMCLNPFIIQAGVPWVPGDMNYLPGAWPHVVCGRITSYITVFITAERCLSIVLPLKVKQIITPRRAIMVICLIYILNILTLIPEYTTSYLRFTFFPEINATLLEIAFTSNRNSLLGLVFIMSSIAGLSSFGGVIVWTLVLVVKLRESSRWRKEVSKVSDEYTSCRDKKTIKMVAIIAIIVIVCYTPGTIVGLATFLEAELNMRRRYANLATALWIICFVFQSVNSSVNIFLYYTMSSNYRMVFGELFSNIGKLKWKAMPTDKRRKPATSE